MIKIWIIAGLVFGLQSCECFYDFNGKVVDANSHAPLDNVEILVIERHQNTNKVTTDTSGLFAIHARSSGLTCPTIRIQFSKAGYQTLVLQDDDAFQEILLEKE